MNAILRVGALLLCSARLWGQVPAAGTLPRVGGTSFLVARYNTGSSASLYVAKRFGPGMVVAGVIGNPSTGYRAGVIGGGTRLRLARRSGVSIILAGASATDGVSLRGYLLPRMSFGVATLAGSVAAYQPLTGTSVPQLLVDPLTVSLRVAGSVRAGVAVVATAREGRRPDYGAGPCAQVRVPGGTLSLEVVAKVRSAGPQLRGAFSAAL